MSDKKNGGILKEGYLVVKNKKFKVSDMLALVIWIYATNVEMSKEKNLENLKEELSVTQNS